MVSLLILLVEAAVLACIVFFLLGLRNQLGLFPVVMFAMASLLFANLTAPIFWHNFLNWEITQGSGAPFVVVLFIFLLLYDLEGFEEAKKFFQSIIITSILILPLVYFLIWKAACIPSVNSPFSGELIVELLGVNPRTTLASLFALLVDGFFLMFLYHYLGGMFPRLHSIGQVFITLLLTLWLDSLIFALLSFGFIHAVKSILAGHIAAKSILALVFSLFYGLARLLYPLKSGVEKFAERFL